MSDIMQGIDALGALNDEGGNGGERNEFNSFSSGTTYKVKVLGTTDLMSFISYGIYKKVNSFNAKNPFKKTKNGYPIEEVMSWNLAYRYNKIQSKELSIEYGQNAEKYHPN